MKRIFLLNRILLFVFALVVTSCTNETLEGEFVTDDGSNNDAVFTAKVNGDPFTATSVTAQLNDGVFIIAGINQSGDVLSLVANSVGECTFDLSLGTNPAQYIPVTQTNPYVTLADVGGSGSLIISSYDPDTLSASGTFQFTAKREVDNGSGGTTTETVVVTEGVFENVSIELVAGTADANACDDGGDGGNVDPAPNFFALVDGNEFIDETLEVTTSVVFDTPMINIVATAANGAQIRIDIPQNIGGIGTYTFPPAGMPISNGAILFASYNDAMGGESFNSVPETGTLTITEFGNETGKLRALFSFTGQDPIAGGPSVQITEGSFRVDFIENSGNVENSFTADIDGISYVPDSIEVTQSPFNGATIITITSIDSVTNTSLTVSFPIDIEIGDFEMSPFFEVGDEKVGIHNPNIGNSILFKSSPGTLSIFSYEYSSGILEGGFTFSAVDPLGNDPTVYEVTNGYFVITLQ
ncbi:MAG: DUF6252 family protein [Flavobacteriaceae bacterium]